MVEGQHDVDFWTSDCLEMSFLAGKQQLGLGMESSTVMLPPGGCVLPDTRGHLNMLAVSNGFLNNSNTSREWVGSMTVCAQVAESGETYSLLRPLWVNTGGARKLPRVLRAHWGLDKCGNPAG